MSILRESMTRFKCHPYTIRVWRQEGEEGTIDRHGLVDEVLAITLNDSPESWARGIIALPNVNAVEVLTEQGEGEVLYKDWP